MLNQKQVKIKWNNANKKKYIEKGYKFTKIGEEFAVDIVDLLCYSDIPVSVVCDYCGKEIRQTYKNYVKSSAKGKDCCFSCSKIKTKENNLSKYGRTSTNGLEYVKEKRKNTCLNKYGVENPSSLDFVKEKKINTNKNKYGTDWYVQSKDFENMCVKKFGVKNPMQCAENQNKAANTLMNNGNVPVSKEELKMCAQIAKIFGKDNIQTSVNVNKFILDCVLTVDSIEIDIEYDGHYWHKNRRDYDRHRNAAIIKSGYKVLRIESNGNMPKDEEIMESINTLLNTGSAIEHIYVDI